MGWGRGGFAAIKKLEDGGIENSIFNTWWDWGEEGKKLLKNLEVENLKKIKFNGNLVGNLLLKVKQ